MSFLFRMSSHTCALLLRGLPWSASTQEISGESIQAKNQSLILSLEFLEGRAQPEDIHICLNREGRPSGEAYVGFHTDEDYANSKQKHKQNMGSRYIEVYDRLVYVLPFCWPHTPVKIILAPLKI